MSARRDTFLAACEEVKKKKKKMMMMMMMMMMMAVMKTMMTLVLKTSTIAVTIDAVSGGLSALLRRFMV